MPREDLFEAGKSHMQVNDKLLVLSQHVHKALFESV